MAKITGNNQDNSLTGTSGKDTIKGKGGDDWIDGAGGDDQLLGDDGMDTIIDGAGRDRMKGGDGADTFVLVADGDKDRIDDWQPADTIDLSAWGVTDLGDLTFTQLKSDKICIEYAGEEIEIRGDDPISIQDFTADKFVFAAPPTPVTIDFETLQAPPGEYGAQIEAVDPGHESFSWSTNFYFVELSKLGAGITGAENRAGGGDVFATNGFMQDVHFSASDNFEFESATMGSAFNDNLQVVVTGYDDGVAVGSQTLTLSPLASTHVEFDDAIFDSVDRVEFSSSGGTASTAYPQDTTHMYIDDLLLFV